VAILYATTESSGSLVVCRPHIMLTVGGAGALVMVKLSIRLPSQVADSLHMQLTAGRLEPQVA